MTIRVLARVRGNKIKSVSSVKIDRGDYHRINPGDEIPEFEYEFVGKSLTGEPVELSEDEIPSQVSIDRARRAWGERLAKSGFVSNTKTAALDIARLAMYDHKFRTRGKRMQSRFPGKDAITFEEFEAGTEIYWLAGDGAIIA